MASWSVRTVVLLVLLTTSTRCLLEAVVVTESSTPSELDRVDCLTVCEGPEAFIKRWLLHWIQLPSLTVPCNDNHLSRRACRARGCVYHEPVTVKSAPSCFVDPDRVGYQVVNHAILKSGATRFQLKLKQTAVLLTKFAQTPLLNLTIYPLSDHLVRIRVESATNVSLDLPFHLNLPKQDLVSNSTAYVVNVTEDARLTVVRKATGVKLLDTGLSGFVFTERGSQFGTYLPSEDLYGLGGGHHHELRRNMTYHSHRIFATTGSQNAHPFYISMENTSNYAHGVLWWDAHPQKYQLLPAPGLVWQSAGSVIDLFVIMGNNPGHVIELYSDLVGRPAMPPIWALGFHIGDLHRRNVTHVESTLQRNLDIDLLPLDGYYLGDPVEESLKSTNQSSLADLSSLINSTWLEYGLRWTLAQSPRVRTTAQYRLFEQGYKKDVYVRWPPRMLQSPIIATRNLSDSVYSATFAEEWFAYPDFLRNQTRHWWTQRFVKLAQNTHFDGLALVDNEPYGPACSINNHWAPQLAIFDFPVHWKTICPEAVQGENRQYQHAQIHNLYGASMALASQKAVQEATGSRPFVLSASTFPTAGSVTGQLVTKVVSEWAHLKASIVAMLEFSIFAIPLTSSGVCAKISNVQLCLRFQQLTAYFPLTITLNKDHLVDPAHWALLNQSQITLATVDSLRMRYQLLPYLYTQFYHAHRYGQTVARPMAVEFPRDLDARRMDAQFLLGPAILVAPFIHANQTRVQAYIPPESLWYRLHGDFITHTQSNRKHPNHVTLEESDSSRPLLVRGGHIIPIVPEVRFPIRLSTRVLYQQSLELWIAPDHNGTAFGGLYLDDGTIQDPVNRGLYTYLTMSFVNCTLTITPTHHGFKETETPVYLDSIRIALARPGLASSAAMVALLANPPTGWSVTQPSPQQLMLNGHLDLTQLESSYTISLKAAQESCAALHHFAINVKPL